MEWFKIFWAILWDILATWHLTHTHLHFRHPKLFKDVFFPFVLVLIQPLLGVVLLHSLGWVTSPRGFNPDKVQGHRYDVVQDYCRLAQRWMRNLHDARPKPIYRGVTLPSLSFGFKPLTDLVYFHCRLRRGMAARPLVTAHPTP